MCGLNAHSQNPFYIKLDRSNGLHSEEIFDVYQDRRGFIWLATGAGLTRYDGNRFDLIQPDVAYSKAGSEIREDRLGRIWYENFDGQLFYFENEELKALPQPNRGAVLHFGVLSSCIVVALPKELVLYDLETLKIKQRVPCGDNLFAYAYSTPGAYHALNLFKEVVVTDNGVVEKLSAPNFFGSGPIVCTNSDSVMVGIRKESTDRNVFKYTPESGFQNLFPTKDLSFVQNIVATSIGYWICTTSGVYRFEKNYSQSNAQLLFEGSNISNVYEDNNGNHWVSTLGSGIFLVPDIKSNYIKVRDDSPNRIAHFNNQLLVGTKKGRVYEMTSNSSHLKYQTPGGHGVYLLQTDSIENRVFVNGSGIAILDKGFNPSFSVLASVKDAVLLDRQYMAVAATGILGILHTGGMETNSPWQKIFDDYRGKNTGMFSLYKSARGKSVTYDKERSSVYYASNLGLFRLTPFGFEELTMAGASIYYNHVDVFENLLFGLDASGKLFWSRLDTPSNISAVPFFENTLWTNMKSDVNGLLLQNESRIVRLSFNHQKESIEIVFEHGLNDNINDFLLSADTLIIATDEGIIFRSLSNNLAQTEPRFVVHSVKVNGQKRDIRELSNLDFQENNVSIYFSFLRLPGMLDKVVEYSLDGISWIPLQVKTGELQLSSLSHGSFILQFRYSGEDQPIHSLEINIHPPFWLNWWFILTATILFTLIIVFYFRKRTKELILQNTLLREKVTLENDLQKMMMSAIKSQMNPHFFYNALNTIQSFIFTDDKKNAGIYLSKFSRLTRNILEMSQQEMVSLGDELVSLKLYLELEQARFKDDFFFHIDIEESIDIDLVHLPSMLIQPYVENAIVHGLLHKKGNKTLMITFTKRDGNLEVVIDDNGVGRQRSREMNANRNEGHQPYSTKANYKRLQILNKLSRNQGVVYIDKMEPNETPRGTTVIIKIPLFNTYETSESDHHR